MTNKEWLDYLAANAPDELAAWFDSEHVETANGTLDGDTTAQNADSREQLEADVRGTVPEWHVDMVIGWLDRQAAITERDATKRHELFCETCEATTDKQIAKLTAERDNLADDLLTANRQREQYRKLFGMALDWAHEITMLESSIDEGMA